MSASTPLAVEMQWATRHAAGSPAFKQSKNCVAWPAVVVLSDLVIVDSCACCTPFPCELQHVRSQEAAGAHRIVSPVTVSPQADLTEPQEMLQVLV